MSDLRITGISMPEGERDRAAGIVARFGFDLGPMRVRGCALILRHDGEPMAVLPPCRSDKAAVRFSSHEVRVEVTRAAMEAFRGLGGRLPTE